MRHVRLCVFVFWANVVLQRLCKTLSLAHTHTHTVLLQSTHKKQLFEMVLVAVGL